MKLTFEQIKDITFGAERFEENDGVLAFYRFGKDEEAAYSESWLYPRTFATAGVKLHFFTDATAMNLKIKTTEIGYNTLYAMDVYVNKELIGQVKNYPDGTGRGERAKNEYPVGDAEEKFHLGDGEKEIEIYFPWSVKAEIRELSLDGESFVSPAVREKTCIIYGDSITQGATAIKPSLAYAVRIGDWLSAHTVNKAIGSEAYFPELVDAQSGKFSPDYVIVSYGANDWVLRTYDEAEEKCREFWKAVSREFPDAKKFALTPIWYENKNIEAKLGDFDLIEKFIRKVASEFPDVNIIDGSDFVPKDSKFFDDGVHPTDEGFGYFFEGLKKQIEPLL